MYPAYRHKRPARTCRCPPAGRSTRSCSRSTSDRPTRSVTSRSRSTFRSDRPTRPTARTTWPGCSSTCWTRPPAHGPTMPDDVPMPVSPQLLAPDPDCLAAPQLELSQSVEVDGEEYLSPVNSYLGARTKLKISVTNTGTAPVSNVLACSTLANPTCETVGTLAPGATAVRTHEFQMPKTPTNLESVATAEAPDSGSRRRRCCVSAHAASR